MSRDSEERSINQDTAAQDHDLCLIRPWPEGVERRGAARHMFESYRAAFDADPGATFCAGEHLGITLVVAVGDVGRRLQEFVEQELAGEIERKRPEWSHGA